MPSVFRAYCKCQGHIVSDCQVLKARKESKPVVAYTSAESSFKQDVLPSGVTYYTNRFGSERSVSFSENYL